jgi:hypothetical protein
MVADAFEDSRQTRLAAMTAAAARLRGRRPRPPHPSWAPYGRSAMALTEPPRPPEPVRRTGYQLGDDPGDD